MKIKDCIRGAVAGSKVEVSGWVKTRRDSKGGFSFVELNDGSCLANLQLVIDEKCPSYSQVKRLHSGASLKATGSLVAVEGRKQGLELHVDDFTVLGDCPPDDYLIGKQRLNFETLREIPHLRPRTNTFGAVARVRNHLAFAAHRFFQEQGFLYIHTPIITANDCEGAGEQFKVEATSGEMFFGKQVFLTVSGQLEVEPYACSLGDVYTFGPTFRAENSHTTRHLSEFWMIEPEMAFADLARDKEVAEGLIHFTLSSVLQNCKEDLAFFNEHVDKGLLERLNSISSKSFAHLSYTDAVGMLLKSGVTFNFPVSWGMDLQSEHEKYLTEKLGPVIVTDYPASLKPFYMKLSDDEKTVAAMDILVPGIGELVGGSQREDKLDVLEMRMQKQGIHPESLHWYSDLRRFGTVPHAGFGLGFERLVQMVTGMVNIRDVIPYPRAPGRVD